MKYPNLIHKCHRNIIRALKSVDLSKRQYIIYTLYKKLYV